MFFDIAIFELIIHF